MGIFKQYAQWNWIKSVLINTLAPGIFEGNLRQEISKLNFGIDGKGISCEVVLRWMSLDLTNNNSTLVQILARSNLVTSHYLSQCWLGSMLPYGVTRPQWLKAWYPILSSLKPLEPASYTLETNLIISTTWPSPRRPSADTVLTEYIKMIFSKYRLLLINISYSTLLFRDLSDISWNIMALNTLRPRQNGCHFPDNIFKCIFLNENVWILLKISLMFLPKVRIDNIPALVQIMAWRQADDKPLSEPMMVMLLMHICITRPQWVHMHSSHYLDNDP